VRRANVIKASIENPQVLRQLSGIQPIKSIQEAASVGEAHFILSLFRNAAANCVTKNPHISRFSRFLPIRLEFPDRGQLRGWLRNRVVQ